MKYLSLLFLLAPVLLGVVSCKSSKMGPDSYEKPQIRFGSGGGFTGAITTYALLESGKLYEHNSMGVDTFQLVLEVPKDRTKEIFAEVGNSGLDSTNYTSYGNFYHFLEWREGADSSRITWANNDPKIDAEWQEMYKMLKGLVTPTE